MFNVGRSMFNVHIAMSAPLSRNNLPESSTPHVILNTPTGTGKFIPPFDYIPGVKTVSFAD